MLLENKIRELLNPTETVDESYPGFGQNAESESPMQGGSEKPPINNLLKGAGTDASVKAGSSTTLAAGSGPMEKSPPKQGSSKEAETVDLGMDTPGKVASAKAKKQPVPTNSGAGHAHGTTSGVDPATVVNQPSSKGNVHQEQVEADVKALFGEEANLSEEFKTKAAGLFEAILTARVADLREEIETEVAGQAAQLIEEIQEEMVDKVDAYLNYVAEQWLEQNEVAIVEGLRAEVTEDFITGLRDLFAENFIDVPEDKVDVLGEMAEYIAELESQLNEQMDVAISLSAELDESARTEVLAQVTEGLAKTEIEKFASLVEDVTFEDEASFAEKLKVLRGNYFPNAPVITETTDVSDVDTLIETDGAVAAYADRIARTSFTGSK